MISSRELLLAEIEAFLKRHDMKPTVFGRSCLNDGHLVRLLRNGKDISLSRADRIRRFMAEKDEIPVVPVLYGEHLSSRHCPSTEAA